ncbi:hypothetical protein DFH06DRAFT_1339801 [Mycena polygramma]|nr:hypothetical protein DFH06DRAFT_1339801 [Mycena polygramma]
MTPTGSIQSRSGQAKRADSHPDPLQESQLLDIVLVASVDGTIHALNRSTGHALWPISDKSASQPTLAPLVRASRIHHDSDGRAFQETYIVEPQSGDIYVMATPSSPLKRFPFSIPELVDMSPFSFADAGDHRVFVGSKETSMLVVELETGKIKATAGSTCTSGSFKDLCQADSSLKDDKSLAPTLDLDELDGTKPQMSKPTEVLIGRTDYHISIHTRPLNAHHPVQNLSFSTYGPNIRDNVLQSLYKNTADDVYMQSLPNGETISFKASRGEANKQDSASGSVLWAYKFSNPIVAIFDVLRTQDLPSTFVLLQSRPQLSAILPQLNHATSMDQPPNIDSVYIGMVEETGSLFAMSPDRFPLVLFSGGVGRKNGPKLPAGKEPHLELPGEIDAVTAARKQREQAMKERNYGDEHDRCRDRTSMYTDRRCLVGFRPLEGGDGDSPGMRLKRLLDGVPGVLNS